MQFRSIHTESNPRPSEARAGFLSADHWTKVYEFFLAMNTLPERFDSFSASKGAVDCRQSVKEHHYCLRLLHKVGSASPRP